MAIPRQHFEIYKGQKYIGWHNNYFFPLQTEDQARAEWCKNNGCTTPCNNGDKCGMIAKLKIMDEKEKAIRVKLELPSAVGNRWSHGGNC
jgi:hypothetical protein